MKNPTIWALHQEKTVHPGVCPVYLESSLSAKKAKVLSYPLSPG